MTEEEKEQLFKERLDAMIADGAAYDDQAIDQVEAEINEEEPSILTTEVFNTFFRENYCPIDYANVKIDFEELCDRGLEELFIDETDFSKVNDKNFVVFMKSQTYGDFESILDEVFEAINPEIVDAVMDISATMGEQDYLTGIYWATLEQLLKSFLQQLYQEKIAPMIDAEFGGK